MQIQGVGLVHGVPEGCTAREVPSARSAFFVRVMSIIERSELVLIPSHIVMIAVQSKFAYSDSVALAELKQPSRQKINPPCLEICQIAFFYPT